MALPNTHFGASFINPLLREKKHIFFNGIGGVSMCSLAEICLRNGHTVSGYDKSPSPITRALEDMGITVHYEASADNVAHADILVYTLAMPADSPEYLAAETRGIPRISRADFLGALMTGYTHRIGISGTHGKSTTTGMVSAILTAADVDPTVLNGAMMKSPASYNIIGGRDYFAFEACEYMDSFLDFSPTAAVVLNVELDHVDYFPSLDAIKDSFRRFMALTGEDGLCVVCKSDENAMDAAREHKGRLITFGHGTDGDYATADFRTEKGRPAFSITYKGQPLAEIRLRVPGLHSVNDALAAAAVCHQLGIDPAAIEKGLNGYDGVARRMEYIAKTPKGAEVYTDYAHHPTEIAATLAGVASMGFRRVKVIFQPHTFSRTHELFRDFAAAFAGSCADEVIFTDIYPARETNIYGVSSDALADAVRERGKAARCIHGIGDAAVYADESAGEGDMILVMGAGDVVKAADKMRELYGA